MTQNINLFDAGWQKSRRQLGVVPLVYGIAGVTAVLACLHVLVEFQGRGASAELRQVQALVDAERAQAQKASGQAAGRKPDPQLEAEIARLRIEVKQAQEAVAALKGGSFGEPEGFAEYLGAFSRQSLEGVWLTGFTVTGGGEIEIRGRALRPELVPTYLKGLNREELLAGRSFARLDMRRSASQQDSGEAAPFIEFSLNTQDAAQKTENSQ
jgi:hypothetical protein